MNVSMEEREYIDKYMYKDNKWTQLILHDHLTTTCIRKYKQYLCIISGLNIDIMNCILSILYTLENEEPKDWSIVYYVDSINYPLAYIMREHNLSETISIRDLCYYNHYNSSSVTHYNVPFWLISPYIYQDKDNHYIYGKISQFSYKYHFKSIHEQILLIKICELKDADNPIDKTPFYKINDVYYPNPVVLVNENGITKFKNINKYRQYI